MINRDFHKEVRVVYRALRKIYGIEKTQDEALRIFKLVFPQLHKVSNGDSNEWFIPKELVYGIKLLRDQWQPVGKLDKLLDKVINLMEMPVAWEKEPLVKFYEDILPVVMRIRKLTTTEVFRLMDVEDEDIKKIQATGLSNTSQYKLAGNSICKNTLYYIFKNLFVETEHKPAPGTQLSLF